MSPTFFYVFRKARKSDFFKLAAYIRKIKLFAFKAVKHKNIHSRSEARSAVLVMLRQMSHNIYIKVIVGHFIFVLAAFYGSFPNVGKIVMPTVALNKEHIVKLHG